MSETPTTDINDNDFDEFARRAVEFVKESTQPNPVVRAETLPVSNLETEKSNPNKKIAAKLAAAALIIGSSGLLVHEATQPDFIPSEETTIATGDSLWDIASSIEGADQVNTADIVAHIQANNVDILSDGLQAGESIKVPVSVKPH